MKEEKNLYAKEFHIKCHCGCGGVLIHRLELEKMDNIQLANLTIWSGRSYQWPYSIWTMLKNAWRYLFVHDSWVYCDSVLLYREDLVDLRNACNEVLDLLDEEAKKNLLESKPGLEELYQEMLRDDEIDKTITVHELRDALEYVRESKKGKVDEEVSENSNAV